MLKHQFSRYTIYRWVEQYGMPHKRIRGKLWFPKAEVIQWLERSSSMSVYKYESSWKAEVWVDQKADPARRVLQLKPMLRNGTMPRLRFTIPIPRRLQSQRSMPLMNFSCVSRRFTCRQCQRGLGNVTGSNSIKGCVVISSSCHYLKSTGGNLNPFDQRSWRGCPSNRLTSVWILCGRC